MTSIKNWTCSSLERRRDRECLRAEHGQVRTMSWLVVSVQRCGEGTQDLCNVLLHQKCHLWDLTVCPLHPFCALRYENTPSGRRHTLEQEETRRQSLHGNRSQFPIMWLDGVGTYLGHKEPERSAVCLPGNVPPHGHKLIWWKMIAREVSKQPGRAAQPHQTLPLLSPLCLVLSWACRGWQEKHVHAKWVPGHKKKAAGGLRSPFTELQFGARNSPARTDVSMTLRGSEISSSCHYRLSRDVESLVSNTLKQYLICKVWLNTCFNSSFVFLWLSMSLEKGRTQSSDQDSRLPASLPKTIGQA